MDELYYTMNIQTITNINGKEIEYKMSCDLQVISILYFNYGKILPNLQGQLMGKKKPFSARCWDPSLMGHRSFPVYFL